MAKQKTNWDNLVENISQNDWYDTILDNKVLFGIGTGVMLILAIILYGMVGGNNEAPDFTLRDTEGVTFSLSEYEGEKVVILDFMFSTCEPCEKLVKEAIEPYSKKMNNDEVLIICVSVFGEDSEKTLREYAEGYGWRHALDVDPNNSENKG